MLRMLGALALVLGLIAGLAYLVRRTARPRGEMAKGGLLDVVARAPLGPRREVLLLRAAGHHIVVAQTPSSVQSLAHFPIDETDAPPEGNPDDFAGCLVRTSASSVEAQRGTSRGDASEPKPEPLPVTARGA